MFPEPLGQSHAADVSISTWHPTIDLYIVSSCSFCNGLNILQREASLVIPMEYKQLTCFVTGEITVKLWLIYTMIYSAIKKNEIMRFSGKLISLEKIRLREETNTTPPKMSHILYHLLLTPNPHMWLYNMEYLQKQVSGMGPWDVGWKHSTLKTLDLYYLGWIELENLLSPV